MGLKFFTGVYNSTTGLWSDHQSVSGIGVLANPNASLIDVTCYKDFLDPNWSLNQVTVFANDTKVHAVHLSTSNLLRQYGNPKNATKI